MISNNTLEKDTAAFVDDGLKIDRKVELYEHQTVSLQEIQRRMAGIKSILIVLPTASGKSSCRGKICMNLQKKAEIQRG